MRGAFTVMRRGCAAKCTGDSVGMRRITVKKMSPKIKKICISASCASFFLAHRVALTQRL